MCGSHYNLFLVPLLLLVEMEKGKHVAVVPVPECPLSCCRHSCPLCPRVALHSAQLAGVSEIFPCFLVWGDKGCSLLHGLAQVKMMMVIIEG